MKYNMIMIVGQIIPAILTILVVVGAIFGFRRRRDPMSLLMVIGAFLSFLGQLAHASLQVQMTLGNIDWAVSTRLMTTVFGVVYLGNLLFGIGFLFVMLSNSRPRPQD